MIILLHHDYITSSDYIRVIVIVAVHRARAWATLSRLAIRVDDRDTRLNPSSESLRSLPHRRLRRHRHRNIACAGQQILSVATLHIIAPRITDSAESATSCSAPSFTRRHIFTAPLSHHPLHRILFHNRFNGSRDETRDETLSSTCIASWVRTLTVATRAAPTPRYTSVMKRFHHARRELRRGCDTRDTPPRVPPPPQTAVSRS